MPFTCSGSTSFTLKKQQQQQKLVHNDDNNNNNNNNVRFPERQLFGSTKCFVMNNVTHKNLKQNEC